MAELRRSGLVAELSASASEADIHCAEQQTLPCQPHDQACSERDSNANCATRRANSGFNRHVPSS